LDPAGEHGLQSQHLSPPAWERASRKYMKTWSISGIFRKLWAHKWSIYYYMT
jgi:hypothetical protein